MFEALDVVQHERRAAAFGELGQRAFEVHPRHGAFGKSTAARVGKRRLVVERVGHVDRPPGAAAQVVETEVDRQPIEPRPERRLAAEAVELPVRRQEDLLEHVLRVGRVAQHADGHAVEPPRMRPIHLFERPEVALPASFDQREVVLP